MPSSPDRSTRAPRPGSADVLERPVTRLLGKRTAAQLAKQGVETGADLLRLLPRRYDTWGELTDMRTLAKGEQATIQAQIVRASSRRTRSGRAPAIMEATVTDGVSTMDVVQFGAAGQMRARATRLAPGTTVLMSGKVGLHRGRRQLSNPRLYVLDELDEAERDALLARPMPIYPGTEALPSWSVAKAVRTVLDQVGPDDVPDPLPDELRRSCGLVDAYTAYRWVHRPEDADQWKAARKRLRHEEALILQVALAQRRALHEATRTAVAWPEPEATGSLRADLDAALPYELTVGQVRVGREIAADLARAVPMQRLLQGDVGSGKTLVALRAMLQVVGAGGQAALLAPTEVLAAQHHSSLEALLGPLARYGMLDGAERATRVHLLTGSTPVAQRRRILADLAAGEPAIVVGTHALLSDTVQIPFLGLVVVDEQHRFGVAQRDALRERGGVTDPATGQRHTPHLLVMTATPIPRTIAMYGFRRPGHLRPGRAARRARPRPHPSRPVVAHPLGGGHLAARRQGGRRRRARLRRLPADRGGRRRARAGGCDGLRRRHRRRYRPELELARARGDRSATRPPAGRRRGVEATPGGRAGPGGHRRRGTHRAHER
ncbi:hypothetical protein HMPREF0975_01637 [Actinomyces sp. oral taxon 849 str. F0330]|nr:hypothetical protein HMPREF0975_01637 [Actinomyces sp. oral taxon 849 str. F0330]